MSIEVLTDKGVSNREVARLLGVSEGTVRYHRRRQATGAVDGRRRQVRKAAAWREAIECWLAARGEAARAVPDLVERDFTAEAPDRLWVADITYVPIWEGFLHLAVVRDACSRRVVGWAMAAHLRTELVLEALEMALARRRPEGVIHHSGQGSQYTSLAFGRRCEEAGVRASMGSVGDCYDNAMAESIFATLECELIERCVFRSRAEARRAVFEFIEDWYNPRRRHSALGHRSPAKFERCHAQRVEGAQPSNGELSTETG